jgi:hypothetical protein
MTSDLEATELELFAQDVRQRKKLTGMESAASSTG